MASPSAPPKLSAKASNTERTRGRDRTPKSNPRGNLDELAQSLRSHREHILDEWLKSADARAGEAGLDADTLRSQSGDILDGLAAVVAHGEIGRVDGAEYVQLVERLDAIAGMRVASKVPLVAVGHSLSLLKETLAKRRRRNGWGEVDALFPVIDGLVFSTFERVLTRRERFFNAIIETAANGIVTIDKRGIVQTFNTAAEEMLGRGVGTGRLAEHPQPLGRKDRVDAERGAGVRATGRAVAHPCADGLAPSLEADGAAHARARVNRARLNRARVVGVRHGRPFRSPGAAPRPRGARPSRVSRVSHSARITLRRAKRLSLASTSTQGASRVLVRSTISLTAAS